MLELSSSFWKVVRSINILSSSFASINIVSGTKVATRPDIAFAVGAVSRFMSNPGKKHWDAVKLILRYLSGTKDKCLCLGRGDLSSDT